MSNASEPTIEQLREESARSREALAATVVELRERVGASASELKTKVSPGYIKQEINAYVRHERQTLVKMAQRKAKENPLQMAAIGAAVAYPALGLLRALPAPVWLIGAGLFLTSRRGKQTVHNLSTTVDEAFRQGAEQIVDRATSIQSDLQDRATGARYALEEVQDTVATTASDMASKARATFQDALHTVGDAAQGATDTAKGTSDRISQSAAQTAHSVKFSTVNAATTSAGTISSFLKDNALLIAGAGAAVGAFIAAAIPPSDAENDLFGKGSDTLKKRAGDLAEQGIAKAGETAAEALGAMAAAATQEGLDARGVEESLRRVAGSARAVADRGLGTALGEPTHSHNIND